MYELFEHTADLGLRVRAADFAGLLCDAGAGLFSMIVEPLPTARDVEREIAVSGNRDDLLLFDWLNELLFLCESQQLLCGWFEVRRSSEGILGRVAGERLDPSRHRLLHEVKAITYHGLRVEQTAEGWEAEVIVDI